MNSSGNALWPTGLRREETQVPDTRKPSPIETNRQTPFIQQHQSPTEKPDSNAPLAIVIGTGFGGLAAAIRLLCKGYRVQVVEKLDAPGGRAYTYFKNGYVFDAGPTIITAPNLLQELWHLAGKKFEDDIQLQLMDPFYRIRFDDGDHFDYRGTFEAMRQEIARISPNDVAGYDHFVREAERCYQLGFVGMADTAFDSFSDLLGSIPDMLRMGAWRTLYGMVCQHIKNPKLRMVLSVQSLLIGGNPMSVTSAYSLIAAMERREGVHWAIGGTGAIVRAMVKLIESLGGQIQYNAQVDAINVVANSQTGKPQAKGITLQGGQFLPADLVVSNADAAWTYSKLIAPQFRKVWTDKKLARADYSMSVFVWYFGTNKRYDDVPHHMMVLGPRYEGLLKDIFKHKVVPDDFSMYLHRPTATDQSMAPEGCDTYYVLVPVPHLDSGTDWKATGEAFRAAVQKRLEDTVLPNLGEHVTESFFTTPQDFHDRLLSVKGAAFGLEPILLQSAWFRPHNRSEDIPGLYMVGAGTHPGAGVPGVLSSAKALEKVLPDATEWGNAHSSKHQTKAQGSK
jgi:phytoene desaturase